MSTEIERMEMCIAEAGYDTSHVDRSPHDGLYFRFDPERVPERVIWRAREIAEVGIPMCHDCWDTAGVMDWECQTTERLSERCGRTVTQEVQQ